MSNPIRNVVIGLLGIHRNNVNSPKPSGFYEITYQDGTTYHGVGTEGRMRQSASQHATSNNPVAKNGMNDKGFDMYPRKGNKGLDVVDRFGPEKVKKEIGKFYKGKKGSKYKSAAESLFKILR